MILQDSKNTEELTDENIKKKISSNLEGINTQSKNYIKDIVDLINREIGINKIVSILLFGSQRKDQEKTPISDCDLLFIFKNRVSNQHIRDIEKYFIALEIKHDFRDPRSDILHYILGVLQNTTGMFMSHFLTKERFWKELIFYKIFRVNRVFSAIFAPKNIVLGNVIQNSTVLYGVDLRGFIKPKIHTSINEMFKSMVMNLFISFFALMIGPPRALNGMRYQLEAIKWSLKASNFYCFGDTAPILQVIDRFVSLEKTKNQEKARKFYEKFLALRETPLNDFRFMARCPVRILKIHAKAINYRKIIKRKEIRIPSKPPNTPFKNFYFPIQF
jgi:predicted nucleotidyltransferase